MSLYLCVDCGGSKTSAVIVDGNGALAGRALGGPSNFAYIGIDAFTKAVRGAIEAALKNCIPAPPTLGGTQQSFLPTTLFAAAWFGVSGVDSPPAVATVTPVLSELLGIPIGPRLIITNDTHLLAAPVRHYSDVSHAVAVIAGTGSICVSFREEGDKIEELSRAGGWGWILGDEGGGFYVGREALREILLEHDTLSVGAPFGSPPMKQGTLTGRVLEHFGVQDVMELLTAVHVPNPNPGDTVISGALPLHFMARERRISSLSPIVFAAAFEDGDALATRALQSCARFLASQIVILLALPGDTRPKAVTAKEAVICFGGSLVGIVKYRDMILGELRKLGHEFRYVEFVNDPALAGAVGLAMGTKV